MHVRRANAVRTRHANSTRPVAALSAIGASARSPGPAIAAPTQTKITLPADPSYITYPATGASGLAVTGTSNGKPTRSTCAATAPSRSC